MDQNAVDIIAAILVAGRVSAMQKGFDEVQMASQWKHMADLVAAEAKGRFKPQT